MVSRGGGALPGHPERVKAVLEEERRRGLDTLNPFQEFRGGFLPTPSSL